MTDNPCRDCPALERSVDDDHFDLEAVCSRCHSHDYRSPSGEVCPECGSDNVKENAEDPEFIIWYCLDCNREWYFDAAADAEARYFGSMGY